MMTLLIVVHVIICIALIFIVLIQTGKGGLDSNFGGMATSALGTQGANDFVKLWTKILFAAFVVSCVLLAGQVKRNDTYTPGKSLIQDEAKSEVGETLPAQMPTEELPVETAE
ncbi:MAG: preprotein translocase subunit SecG [Candidatus Cloacimonetes bacterium]|jgi:preprotein translocase subunit SecG|nr:preprotein translocase subunit SecG [Candidatus Cloacimonadota bacterium]MDD4154942.1 preprotein translocase subunit SecG [Candidatus Cloacimonadota bacterium]